MKIVTWNCQGAFRRKMAVIEALQPDLAIIEECECAERLSAANRELEGRDIAWCGDRPVKGLAVIASSNLHLQIASCYDPSIKHLLPITVIGKHKFHLLAVWTKQSGKDGEGYVGQACLGVDTYSHFLDEAESVVIGDFNSNMIWDHPRRKYSHSILVDMLAEKGLQSAYHWHYREEQGQETRNTLFMARNQERGYHIDFCFLPASWLARLASVHIGSCDEWLKWSDHCPVVVDLISS